MKRTPVDLIIYYIAVMVGFGVIVSCSKKSTTSKSRSSENGWETIFNGKNLPGWVQLEGKAEYTVQNGNIVGTTVPNGGNGILATKKEFSDFMLELEVKADTALNSGIQIRSHSNKKGQVYGYQIEVDPSSRAWSGGIYDSRRRGWLVDLKNKPGAQKAFKNGQWNHYRKKVKADTIKTWVNQIPVATLVDSMDFSRFMASGSPAQKRRVKGTV